MSRPHRLLRLGVRCLPAWLAAALIADAALAQTDPAPQALPYSQDFEALPHASTVYPAGWQGWINGPAGAVYPTAGPTADQALLAPSSASTSTGGIHNYAGKLGPLDNTTNDYGLAFAINATGATGVRVEFDIMTIRNPYNGSSNTRIHEISLQYRVGSSGTWTTLPSTAYDNNTDTQVGAGVTTPQKLESRTVLLPVECDNQPVVQLRWTQLGSGTGGRPGFAVDNVVVVDPEDPAATIAALSPPGVITPASPTRTVAVTIARTGTTALRAFSVEIELVSLELSGPPSASISEGTYLSGTSAPTDFQVTDLGGGKYRVDGTIVGVVPVCGTNGSAGTLFEVEVGSSLAHGNGTLTVTDVTLNDCFSGILASAIGAAATVAVDNTPPAVAVLAPNGGESWVVGTVQTINWSATDAAGVAAVDLAYSTNGGATFPFTIALGEPNDGSHAWTVPNAATATARVRVTAHDANANAASEQSAASFAIARLALTVTLAGTGSGSVTRDPDQPDFGFGDLVELDSAPAVGSTFTGWSGDASGVLDPLLVTMDAAKSIIATFTLDTHTLAVTAVGNGSVSRSPDLPSYGYGSTVQLTATAALGWHFVGWSGDAGGSTNPLDIAMTADRAITATFAKNTIVVSQVYGGGGNSGATYTHDFIELFNRGPVALDVTGWTIQYASASGSSWSVTALSGVIPPGRYYLVQQAAGAGGTVALPTPDATGGIAVSATAGKVALVNGGAPLAGVCPAGPMIEDLIGYGAASCSETTPADALSNTVAALRGGGGCVDAGHNDLDFSSGPPTPRNSTSPVNDCLFTLAVTASPPAGGSVAKSPDLPGYDGGSVVQLTATPAVGYLFTGWSGDASGTANPLMVTMDSDQTITAHFASTATLAEVVISQVYGGGGNTGATYRNDFIELFNRGNLPVNLTGWTVQYASAGGGTWAATTLIGVIPPGRHYLIQQAQGAGGTTFLPTPDAIGAIALGATEGKVALVSNNVILAGTCPTSPSIVDRVGYGGANCSETAPASTTSNLVASHRNNGGCDETNHNAADFATGPPTPRNTGTPVNLCARWVSASPSVATEFALGRPAPNPTRGETRVSFALAVESRVRLEVLDVQGRRVASLVNGVLPAGRYEATWNVAGRGDPMRPGLYFIRLEAGGRNLVRTVALTR